MPSGFPIGSGLAVDPENTITPLQLELLALFASGFSYVEIGQTKFMSPWTVRNKLYKALRQSGARNLTQLAAILVDRGLLRWHDGIFEPIQDLRIVSE